MGRTFDRRRRIRRNDLADYQVIKEHFDGGQVLLNRLRRTRVLFDGDKLGPLGYERRLTASFGRR